MKKFLKIFGISLILLLLLFKLYFNNTAVVDKRTSEVYRKLKERLLSKGYKDRLLVISTKRLAWHNSIQVTLSGAASKSRPLSGEAIDFLVFDINEDGNADAQDVDIVYQVLDQELLNEEGGIGTYKHERLSSTGK